MRLDVRDLTTFYGKTQILHSVSLTVASGEVACLLGRNGFGKSTTLKSIMGLVRPAAGSVRLDAHDLTTLAPYQVARAGVGYVPQDRRIFPTLTVRENLLMGVKPGLRAADTRWSLDEVISLFPVLQPRLDISGRVLSGGEQQLLSIARSLMGNPAVLLLDEPTEGLAPVIVEALHRVIRELAAAGLALLFVESKLAVALRIATRVYVIWKGEIVYEGTPGELQQDREARRRYLEV